MRRKVNNSETHETKRYYEVPPEKAQEWSDIIEKLTKQRDQYKTERNSLIDDLSWYKAKVSRLERENEKRRGEITNLCEIVNFFYNTGEIKDNLLSEFSQHIGNKPSSSTYKYFRGKLDGIGIKEGE